MCAHVCGRPKPGLLDMRGITPAQVGGFYEAASYYFRQAPWKEIGDNGAIKVECRGPQNHRFERAEFDRRYRQNFG